MAANFPLLLCMVLASSVASPVPKNETGLGAALSSIAHSVVVVSEDTTQEHGTNASVPVAAVPGMHSESAHVLPSLMLIALTPEAHNVVAETEKIVYSNETDSKGVVKITIVTDEEDSSEESTTETTETTETTVATTISDEYDTATTESYTEATTDRHTEEPTKHSTTSISELTVIGIGGIDKQKEEEIKETIKEVEAMPVILTVGV